MGDQGNGCGSSAGIAEVQSRIHVVDAEVVAQEVLATDETTAGVVDVRRRRSMVRWGEKTDVGEYAKDLELNAVERRLRAEMHLLATWETATRRFRR